MDKPTVFEVPLAARLLSAFGFAVCAILSAFMAGVLVVCLVKGWFGAAAVIAVCTTIIVALAIYVGRDLRGKWGLRVELRPTDLTLALPAGRSLIHRPPAQRATIPYTDIAAIETRLEGYRSLGMATVQRAFALRLNSGDLIFLFEDRALGSRLAAPFCGPIVDAILERAGAPLRDLGMVEGRGGLLAAWGTEAPDWRTPGLDAAGQARIWRAVGFTGLIVSAALALMWALSFL